jgi:hypothetical protein
MRRLYLFLILAAVPGPPVFAPGPTHEISAINAQTVVSGERAGR